MARSLRTGETAPIAVRLPADKLSQLDELAERTGRTRSEVIRAAIDATIGAEAAA
ncbi:MAG: ribbon-helix-helix protein, CopG family [Acidimicrobiia bacterium]